MLEKLRKIARIKSCCAAALVPGVALASVFCAGIAVAVGIGAEQDGSLRWIDWATLIYQAVPWLAVGGIVYALDKALDDVQEALHQNQEAIQRNQQAIIENMQQQLEVIRLIAADRLGKKSEG